MDSTLYIALAAFGGGILAALLGWLDSGESFAPRKFMASVLRALGAGIGFAIIYTFTGPVAVLDLLIAFVSGAGVDVIGNRFAGAIKG